MTFILPGTPRIALLDAGQNKLKTLFLPAPDKGVPKLEWIEKGINSELVDGSESNRRLGFLPELTITWAVYNDQDGQGHAIGGNDQNLADIASFMAIMDAPPGFTSISPGPSAGGFVVNKTTIRPIGIIGLAGFAAGLEVTFRGGMIYPTKILGAF